MTTRTERRHAARRRDERAQLVSEYEIVLRLVFKSWNTGDPRDEQRARLAARIMLAKRRPTRPRGQPFTTAECAVFGRIAGAAQRGKSVWATALAELGLEYTADRKLPRAAKNLVARYRDWLRWEIETAKFPR
jgi:hypothetical protein